ncbi:hypothetical protein SAMN06296952_1051 [Oscillospiraceae bacterium]|nr:hypothetical protein SAMN06296952_1051 [Oscillospiraceae bacterium]
MTRYFDKTFTFLKSILTRSSGGIMSFLDYLIVFLIIISRACAWTCDTNLSLTADDIILWLDKFLIVYYIVAFAFRKTLHIEFKQLLRYSVLLLGFLVFSFLNPYAKDGFTSLYVINFSFIFLWIIWRDNPNEVWKKYTDATLLIACITFVFYFIGSVIHVIPEYNTSERTWGVWKPDVIKNFYYLYYESQYITVKGHIIWRNCSIFAEAPKYNFVLCTALSSELFLSKKPQLWRVAILIFMIITTLCAMGMILVVIALFLYAILKYKDTSLGKRFLPYVKKTCVICGICVVVFMVAKYLNDSSSYSIRFDHIKACLKTFGDNKLLGAGWLNEGAVLQYASYKQGIAIGIPLVLAFGGIVLTSLILLPFLRVFTEGFSKRKYNFMFFVLLFLLHFFLTIIPITLIAMLAYVVIIDYERHEVV